MDFIIFILFVCFNVAFLLIIKYYSKLLGDSSKTEFSREEITGLGNILSSEISELIHESGGFIALLPFFVAIILTWLWTLLGGIIGSPHYTSEPGNYFFLSFLILLLTLTFHGEIYQMVLQKLSSGNKNNPLAIFFRPSKIIITGIATALGAMNMTVYGIYHEIWFLFILGNLSVIYFLTILYLNDRYPKRMVFPFIANDSLYEDQDISNDMGTDFDLDETFHPGNTDSVPESLDDEEFKV